MTAVPTPATDPAGTEALIDVVLRVKRPALFAGDWRAKTAGKQTAKWITELELEARELVAAFLTSDALADQDKAAFERGREQGAGEVVARVETVLATEGDWLNGGWTSRDSGQVYNAEGVDDLVATLRAGLAAGGA